MMVTKEQVKKCLEKFANDYLSTREETECFDYAIKAVDAYKEPKEAIIDVVHKTIYGFFDVAADDSEEPMSEKDKLLLEVNRALCNAIKKMPEERKTGRWIIGDYGFICSLCGTEERKNHFPKYCPECGAKMEGAEE